MALIRCEDLVLGYEGREILGPLRFEVNRGDYLCILGENGSGKTTLMRTVLGLQKPVSGRVLTGEGLTRRGIGYLPQQTEMQRDFPATVFEVALSGCQSGCGLRPFYTGEEKRRALDRLSDMGVGELAGHCYRELSGGQQQRVLLARALCAAGTLLLLDEPVSGLDPAATEEMYALLERLNSEQGVTLIMISHDLGAPLRAASHVLHVGKRLFFGSREDYLRGEGAAQ